MTGVESTVSEIWRAIPGWEGHYEASNLGRIRSVDRIVRGIHDCQRLFKGKVLSPYTRVTGHLQVNLSKHGKTRAKDIHVLVALTFIGPRPSGKEVCHNDGNPANNRASNLRYDTHRENALDRVRHGVHSGVNKTHCPQGHLLKGENLVPSTARRGYRACLACSRARGFIQARKLPKSELQRISDWYYRDTIPSE